VNHKRVYRLYSAAKRAVKKRKQVKRISHERVLLRIAQRVNEVWRMDFVSDSRVNGRRIKGLAVTDDFLSIFSHDHLPHLCVCKVRRLNGSKQMMIYQFRLG
jgi:rRNA maturation protein Rpf1